MDDWQPIETAPKDGTLILACSTKRQIRRVTWWRNRKEKAGYIGWGEFNAAHWPPDYWMPLPEIPGHRP